jgi:lipopolysaccharide transport system ATP-binding protein
MSKKEIDAAFNDIIDFAGVDRFLDTAVKRYSSGMKVRLGFAIAAHLNPDILIVDEVLSVGDASFREKCLNKMNEVSSQGRTVLFVSHNLAALSNLCSRAYLMEGGRIIQSGSPQEIISTYMSKSVSQGTKSLLEVDSRKGDGIIRFEDIVFNNISYRDTPTIATGENCKVVFKMKVNESFKNDSNSSVDVRITFYNSSGQNLFTCSSQATGIKLFLEDLSNRIEMKIEKLPLTEGQYSYNLFATYGGQVTDRIQKAGVISVVAGDYFGTGYLNSHSNGMLVKNKWRTLL